jgi:Leucine-rich repeat (LRR) protein
MWVSKVHPLQPLCARNQQLALNKSFLPKDRFIFQTTRNISLNSTFFASTILKNAFQTNMLLRTVTNITTNNVKYQSIHNYYHSTALSLIPHTLKPLPNVIMSQNIENTPEARNSPLTLQKRLKSDITNKTQNTSKSLVQSQSQYPPILSMIILILICLFVFFKIREKVKLKKGTIDLSKKGLAEFPTFEHPEDIYHLNLSYNNIQSIPPTIAEFVNLRSLIIDQNMLTELPIELAELQNLEEISISFNPIAYLPPNFHELISLKHFRAMLTLFDEFPEELEFHPNLQSLNLSFNRISELPPNLELPNLEILSLKNNYIVDVPLSVQLLPSLRLLDLSSNEIMHFEESNDPHVIDSDSFFPKLIVASLNSNHLKTIPSCLKEAKSLQKLSLQFNDIEEFHISLRDFPSLFELNLNMNPINIRTSSFESGFILKSLSLTLQSPEVDADFERLLSHIKKLDTLVLSFLQIVDEENSETIIGDEEGGDDNNAERSTNDANIGDSEVVRTSTRKRREKNDDSAYHHHHYSNDMNFSDDELLKLESLNQNSNLLLKDYEFNFDENTHYPTFTIPNIPSLRKLILINGMNAPIRFDLKSKHIFNLSIMGNIPLSANTNCLPSSLISLHIEKNPHLGVFPMNDIDLRKLASLVLCDNPNLSTIDVDNLNNLQNLREFAIAKNRLLRAIEFSGIHIAKLKRIHTQYNTQPNELQ